MSSPVGVDKGSRLAQQLVGVGAKVVTLGLNEVCWEGLQPSVEGGKGESEGRSMAVGGDVWERIEGVEKQGGGR